MKTNETSVETLQASPERPSGEAVGSVSTPTLPQHSASVLVVRTNRGETESSYECCRVC